MGCGIKAAKQRHGTGTQEGIPVPRISVADQNKFKSSELSFL